MGYLLYWPKFVSSADILIFPNRFFLSVLCILRFFFIIFAYTLQHDTDHFVIVIIRPPVTFDSLQSHSFVVQGFRGRSKNVYSIAVRRVHKALQYQYVSRKLKKRDMRSVSMVACIMSPFLLFMIIYENLLAFVQENLRNKTFSSCLHSLLKMEANV